MNHSVGQTFTVTFHLSKTCCNKKHNIQTQFHGHFPVKQHTNKTCRQSLMVTFHLSKHLKLSKKGVKIRWKTAKDSALLQTT